jgi:hypothetical protein
MINSLYQDYSGELFAYLDDNNYHLFAVKHYVNPNCSGPDEFYKDINKIKSIKKQLTKYHTEGSMNERLFLNYVITFFNVFAPDAAKVLLFYKLERDHWIYIKTTMAFLKFMKEEELPEIPINKDFYQMLDAL